MDSLKPNTKTNGKTTGKGPMFARNYHYYSECEIVIDGAAVERVSGAPTCPPPQASPHLSSTLLTEAP